MRCTPLGVLVAMAGIGATPASAAPAATPTEREVIVEPRPSKRTAQPWIRRWAPERNQVDIGIFGGALVVPRDHELFRPMINREDQGHLPLRRVALALGLRLGYFPLRFAGIEAEGALMPTRTDGTDAAARLFGARGHLVLQLPYTITPFVVGGAGALGVASAASVLGTDTDPALHIGVGGKVHLGRRLHVRLDLRDYITPGRGVGGGATNWLEATLGIGMTFGRRRHEPLPPPPPPPPPPADSDGDGWVDSDDACPEHAGIEPDGCPPTPDSDDDGYPDLEDKCPQQPGIAPDGCPDLDPDNDGVLLDVDVCPDAAETHNGFEDSDGCPDAVPEELTRFEGTLAGVTFALDRATLRRGSEATLDAAVEVLEKFPEIRVEVSGHTDASGAREHNMELSQQRAATVTQYLTNAGIDPARIETRGAGPDEPVDTNATKAGRGNNRRIEFRVLR